MISGISNFRKNNLKSKLTQIFIRNKVVLFGNYKFSESGLKDNKYLDMNRIISDPKGMSFITQNLVLICREYVYKKPAVLGLAHTGIPYATLVANRLGLRLGYVRKKRKEYGTKKVIEGNFPINTPVIVIDDMIADPRQTLPFLKAIKKEGLEIIALAVVIELLPPSKSKNIFENEGYHVLSLLQYNDYLELESFVRDEK